jgi:tetratricopeptide (TPR) repeat protein
MKKTIILLSVIILISSCIQVTEKNKEQELIKQIENAEKNIKAQTDVSKLPSAIDSFVVLIDSYTSDYKNDSLIPELLYKKGSYLMEIKKYKKALNAYSELYDNYPNFNKRPETLFFIAVLYGDFLHNESLAAIKYKEFIKKYPNHDLRDDAEMSLKFLGKTDKEILEILTKQNKENKDSL